MVNIFFPSNLDNLKLICVPGDKQRRFVLLHGEGGGAGGGRGGSGEGDG